MRIIEVGVTSIVFVLLLATSCNEATNKDKHDRDTSKKQPSEKLVTDTTSSRATNKQVIEEEPYFDDPFKYDHLNSFTPNSHRAQDLKPIDSTYFVTIIQQLESFKYDPFEADQGHFFISKQHQIGRLRAETVVLSWDLCYQGIELLLIDENDILINHLRLTEWESGCEVTSNTTTEFINDSTFIQHETLAEPGMDTIFYTEIKYKAFIDQEGQLDTLETIFRKEYQE